MATKKESKTKVGPTVKAQTKKILLASSNPHLSIFPLGVYFKDGKFETTDRKLADMVLKYDGVFEI